MKVIILKYGDRILSCFLRYFLEMLGFIVESVADSIAAGSRLFKELDAGKELQQDADHVFFDLSNCQKITFREIQNILECQGPGIVSPADLHIIEAIWHKIYSDRVMQNLYTISELYINKKMKYTDVSLLENSIYELNKTIRQIAENEAWMNNWYGRIASCYLKFKVNDALQKMEERRWYESGQLLEICKEALLEKPQMIGIFLLKANILREQRHLGEYEEDNYMQLYNCTTNRDIKKYALLGLGEEYQLDAEKKKKKLYAEALKLYLKYEKADPDNVRVLFKIAVQKERMAELCGDDWEEARSRYRRICDNVSKIGFANVSNVEFEYYYKARFRLGAIAKIKAETEESINQFSIASRCWDWLKNNQYLSKIYDAQEWEHVVGFLQEKYKRRDCIIWQQLAELYEGKGELEKAREYYIRANTYAHRFGQ